MRRELATIAFIFFACLSVAMAKASSSSSLSADGLSKMNNLLMGADKAVRRQSTVELTGNVQLIFQGQHLAADHAIIYFDTKKVYANGKVVIENATSRVEAQEVFWNYETNTGTIWRGSVQSGQVYFEGEVIDKTGERDYTATHAKYTACSTCPPGWGFSGRKIDAELGGYAYIHRSTLHFAKVPVLWLPYLIVPLKSSRQTGLLPPIFGLENGFTYNQRFFWAISRSQDATLSAKYYQNRGLKSLVNYRYILSSQSEGSLDTGYIRDRLFADDPVFKPDRLNNDPGWAMDRWFLKYQHQYYLPDGFNQKVNLNLVRDLRYPRDFTDDMSNQGDPALDNRVSITKNTQTQHLSLDNSYYINLVQEDPLADNRSAVHRLPELRYSIIEQPIDSTPFTYSLDAKYSNFVRQTVGYDSVNLSCASGDRCLSSGAGALSAFNPNKDLIRSGQRLIVTPSLAAPFQLGPFISIEPRSTLTYSQYQFAVDPAQPTPGQLPGSNDFNTHPSMTQWRNSVSAKTRFSHVYGNVDTAEATRWKHSFEPEAVYTTVPYVQRSPHPFFGPLSTIPLYRRDMPITDTDFSSLDPTSATGVQFDYNDRIVNRNVAGVILHNYLTRKVVKGQNAEYLRIGRLDIGQSYDYDEDRKGANMKRSWGPLNTLLDVRLENFNTNTTVDYYPYHRVSNIASRVMINDQVKFLQLTYTETFQITQQIPADYNTRSETLGIAVGLNSKYLQAKAGLNFSLVEPNPGIQSWDYVLNIKPPGNCMAILLGISQPITGPQATHVSFDFKFDGQGVNPGQSAVF